MLPSLRNLRRFIAIVALVVALVPLEPALALPPVTHDIATCDQLQNISAADNDTINLTADLDCDGIDFGPLFGGGFAGLLEGNGHSISNLSINQPGSYNNGLFSSTNGATIQNLVLASGTVIGSNATGALIGVAQNTTITNVVSHVDVQSVGSNFGGLIGQITGPGNTLLEDVAVTGDVSRTSGGSYVGGIAGYTAISSGVDITLRRVSYTGAITLSGSGTRVGGFLGMAQAQGGAQPARYTIEDSYMAGTVNGTAHNETGGLVGAAIANGSSSSTISLARVYTNAAVTGTYGVGGLFGIANSTTDASNHISIIDSFAVGAITALGDIGGLLGANSADPPTLLETTNAYYDGPGTGQSACAALLATDGDCTRINTSAQPGYFKGNHTNEPMASWNFTGIWSTVPSAYPVLIPPDDGDGIAKADELAGPNAGDANADSIADAAQSDVAAFSDPVSGHYAVLQTSCGDLFNVQVGAESGTAGQADVAYDYPGGLVQFIATGCTPGATATITHYYFGLQSPSQYTMRKWHDNTYTTVSGATFSAVTIGGQSALRASYQVTDGSALDDDGAVDGNIVDPAGPATNVLGAPNTGSGALSRR